MENQIEKEKKGIKGILAILGILGIYFAPLLGAYTNTVSISGTVVVPGNCIFSANVASLNFGSVQPGTNTLTQNDIAVTNGGNTQSNILTSGNNWAYLSNSFDVHNTIYSNVVGVGTSTAFRLTSSSVDTLIVANLVAANQIWYGVQIPSAQAPGTYAQTVSVISSC